MWRGGSADFGARVRQILELPRSAGYPLRAASTRAKLAALFLRDNRETLQPRRSIGSKENCAYRQVGPDGRGDRGETGSAKCPAELDQLHALRDQLTRLGRRILHARNADACQSADDVNARGRGAVVKRVDERPFIHTSPCHGT